MLSSDVALVLGKLANAVATVLNNDQLKVITILYKTQDPDLVDIVSSECKFEQELSTEIKALSWVLKQAKCPITNLK